MPGLSGTMTRYSHLVAEEAMLRCERGSWVRTSWRIGIGRIRVSDIMWVTACGKCFKLGDL